MNNKNDIYLISSPEEIADILRDQIAEDKELDLRSIVCALVKGRQVEISKATGIRQATISDYVTGKRDMLSDTLETIVNYCLRKN